METSKQKLDSLLGISDSGSIDDFLAGISSEPDSLSAAMKDINGKIKDNISEVDSTISQAGTEISKSIIDISKITTITDNVESTLAEVKDLIDISKKMILHVYESAICTDLVDPEVILAFAKMIESARINISDSLELYKSRIAFYDKLRFSVFQQQQKIELMNIKHLHDMEKIKENNIVINAVPENSRAYNQEEIIKLLNNTNQIDGEYSECIDIDD